MAELNCGTERACNDCLVGALPKGEVTREVICALSVIAGNHFRNGSDEMFNRATDLEEASERAHFILQFVTDDDDYVTSEQRQAVDVAVPHIVSGECITE